MPAPPSSAQTAAKNATVASRAAVGSGAVSATRTDRAPSTPSSSLSSRSGAPDSRTDRAPTGSLGAPDSRTDRAPVASDVGGLSKSLSAAVDPRAEQRQEQIQAQQAQQEIRYSTPQEPIAPMGQNPFRDPRRSYGGPIGGTGVLTPGARFAVANQANFKPGPLIRQPGDAEAMARMANAESAGITNEYGKPNTESLQATMDVIRNRMLSGKVFGKSKPGVVPNSVQDIISQRKQFSPYADGTYKKTKASPTDIKLAEGILSGETPSVVDNALNYANTAYLKTPKGIANSSEATRKAFANMPVEAKFVDAKRKGVMQAFGTIGTSDVAFNDTSPPPQESYQVAGDTVTKTPKAPSVSQVAQEQSTELSKAIEKVRQSLRQPAGTLTAPYDPIAKAAGTLTTPYNKQPGLLDDVRKRGDIAFENWKKERATKKAQEDSVRKAAGTLTSAYDAPEDLTRAAYEKSMVGVEDLRRSAMPVSQPVSGPSTRERLPGPNETFNPRVSGPSTRAVMPSPKSTFNPATDMSPESIAARQSLYNLPSEQWAREQAGITEDPKIKVSGPKTRTPVTTAPNGVVKAVENVDEAPKAYDPATGYGAGVPELKPYRQTPEDLARQAAQVAAFKESIKKGVNPALASTLSPITDAMKYYSDNKFSIGLANKLGLLEKPVNKVAGAAITQMQNYIRGLGEARPKDVSPAKPGNQIAGVEQNKPPTKTVKTQVAETMIQEPEKALEASPELQKVAATSPSFLQRLFADADKKGGKGNKFKEYLVQVAQAPTPTGTLNDNDSITAMFKSLSGGLTT